MSMSKDQKNVVDSSVPSQADHAQAKAEAQLKHRRQILKAAAIAAPMLVTLHAKSAFAGGGQQNTNLASSGINYGPGAYLKTTGTFTSEPDPILIPEPKQKKKKRGR